MSRSQININNESSISNKNVNNQRSKTPNTGKPNQKEERRIQENKRFKEKLIFESDQN